MKIYSFGLDQLTVSQIKSAGYTVITQNLLPDPPQTQGNMLLVTSEQVPIITLRELRQRYQDTTILYAYMQKGVRSYQTVHMLCECLGIYFIPPRSTASSILEKLRFILEEEGEKRTSLIGFFGSGPGIGCTSSAKLFAWRIAAAGYRVLLLGLDLYDSGYDRKTSISLDRLRPKLTGKMLQAEDFEQWIKQDGYHYLPGNFDYLSAQDYQEEEIEYLLDGAVEHADVVVADFGSIPESAAWYVGMRKSALRMFVTHPKHEYRMEPLLELAGHMDLGPQDFQLIINRSNLEEITTPKNLAYRIGSEILLELPYVQPLQDSLSLGKRELQQVDDKVRFLLVALGLAPETRKKGLFS